MRTAKSKAQENKEVASKWTWSTHGSLFIGDCGSKSSAKIASFDMDGTLINTKSGAKFPKDAYDWVMWH